MTNQITLLNEQTQTSVTTICDGLNKINDMVETIDYANCLRNLTNGLEFFGKVIISLHYFNTNKKWPQANDIKTFGHDISSIINTCIDIYESSDVHMRRDHIRYNCNKLKSDIYRKSINLLDKYADAKHRYESFNTLTTNNHTTKIEQMVNDLIDMHLKHVNPNFIIEFELALTNNNVGPTEKIQSELIISSIKETYARIAQFFSQLLAFGFLEERGKKISHCANTFLMIDDSRLGTRHWSPDVDR